MWNDINTGAYSGMIAETVSIPRENGDKLNVYYSRPITSENVPSIVLIDAKVKTLPLIGGGTIWCSYASFVPPIIVYAFFSKHIVEGVALGSVKT